MEFGLDQTLVVLDLLLYLWLRDVTVDQSESAVIDNGSGYGFVYSPE